PRPSWARHLGLDLEKRERQRRRRDLLRSAPQESDADETLVRWLRDAFDLEDSFESQKIAEGLSAVSARVLAIDGASLAKFERKHRRRLKTVQRLLGGSDAGAEEPIDADESAEDESQTTLSTSPGARERELAAAL